MSQPETAPTFTNLTGSTPLANQVAGHQNVMSDASGSLVIKPALPREIAFYQAINSASKRLALAQLKQHVPQFYGTLRLEGQMNAQGSISTESVKAADRVPESVVLENLAQNYTRPCICDVKLGTELYGPDASEEKRERMRKQARKTTSHETGLRMTGCQTWHEPTQSYILTPKSYGKSLNPSSLPSALKRFLPLPSDVLLSMTSPTTYDSQDTTPTTASSSSTDRITHLPLTPVDPSILPRLVNPNTRPSDERITTHSNDPQISNTLPPSTGDHIITDRQSQYTSHAITPAAMLRLLSLVDEHLAALESVLQKLEVRFIGSSVLILYEGDAGRLTEALNRHEEKRAAQAAAATTGLNGRQQRSTVEEGEEPDSEDDEDEEDDDEEESSTSSDDDSQDGTRTDARRARRCPPVTVKMIDFAHTRMVDGEGPDEGVLKGLKTLRGLIEQRKEDMAQTVFAMGGV